MVTGTVVSDICICGYVITDVVGAFQNVCVCVFVCKIYTCPYIYLSFTQSPYPPSRAHSAPNIHKITLQLSI